MDITKLVLYARGYEEYKYYEEIVYIKTETYNKIKMSIKKLDLNVPLIGENQQEVKGEIYRAHINSEEIDMYYFDREYGSYILSDALSEVYEKHDINFNRELEEVSKFIESCDTMVVYEIRCLKSQLEIVKGFEKMLARRKINN